VPAARWSLVACCWLLAACCWLLVAGGHQWSMSIARCVCLSAAALCERQSPLRVARHTKHTKPPNNNNNNNINSNYNQRSATTDKVVQFYCYYLGRPRVSCLSLVARWRTQAGPLLCIGRPLAQPTRTTQATRAAPVPSLQLGQSLPLSLHLSDCLSASNAANVQL